MVKVFARCASEVAHMSSPVARTAWARLEQNQTSRNPSMMLVGFHEVLFLPEEQVAIDDFWGQRVFFYTCVCTPPK